MEGLTLFTYRWIYSFLFQLNSSHSHTDKKFPRLCARAKSSARTELPERGNKTYLQIATTKRFLWPAKINTGPDDVGQFQDSRFLRAERPMRNESLGEYIIFLSSGEWIKLTIYRQIAEKKVYLLRADKGEFKWPLLKARKDKSRRFIASPLSHVHKLFSAVCRNQISSHLRKLCARKVTEIIREATTSVTSYSFI